MFNMSCFFCFFGRSLTKIGLVSQVLRFKKTDSNLQKTAIVEVGAVQMCADLVDLSKILKTDQYCYSIIVFR